VACSAVFLLPCARPARMCVCVCCRKNTARFMQHGAAWPHFEPVVRAQLTCWRHSCRRPVERANAKLTYKQANKQCNSFLRNVQVLGLVLQGKIPLKRRVEKKHGHGGGSGVSGDARAQGW
jgi:hypothetical protein